ncbi:MAG: energy transducer TonB [Candidatus Poribacteria bacterium]|nr:energy transducer TonB [Candidatus Poribacteria bacterium]
MSSRTSGMLTEMQQRRAERKKPKRFVALKKVSLDTSQQQGISTAQANVVKHPITQKHVGRSSTAFSVAIAFHVIIGFVISAFFIAEQIEMNQETFDISIVTEEPKTKRRLRRRETPKFETKPQQQQVLIQRPLATATSQLPSRNGFVIPQGAEATVDLSTPGADEGPKMIEVDRNFAQPSRSLEPETKAPGFEIQREAPTLINKLDVGDILEAGPGLGGVDFEPEPGVTNPQYKFKVEPKYPDSAKKAQKEGEVLLQATIDENGIPQDIKALTNLGFGFEEAAIDALKKTTFRPAMKGGEPISKQVTIPYKFTLKDN